MPIIKENIIEALGKYCTLERQVDPVNALERGKERAQVYGDLRGHILEMMPYVWNTNTVNTDLKRTVILQESIRNFAIKVLPLKVFSIVHGAVRLEGTDQVAVPYFPLDQTASTDFNSANGYDTFGNTNSDRKLITINKRKYQGLKFTSAELDRQPFMNSVMGMSLKTEQLAIDALNDILSAVTIANFPNSTPLASEQAFDSDDVADLKALADTANWLSLRALVVNSACDVNLLKDKAIKNALNWGDNKPIREGRIFNISSFDYYPDSRVPGNAQGLVGFINHPSAMLVAFSPTEPTPEVRSQLTRYNIIVEPETGATLEFRSWGNPDLDQSRQIMETSYGYAPGEPTALRRLTVP